MKKYYSKIGFVFVAPVSLAMIAVAFSMASKSIIGASIFVVAMSGLLVYITTQTYYYIDGKTLVIRAGFLINKIDIASIRKISETNDLTSAPALSIDRLEIMYHKFDTQLVSPKDKTDFINNLKNINPEIEIHLRNK